MPDKSQAQSPEFIELAGDIVSAYVSNNSIPASELAALIGNVYSALTGLAVETPSTETETVERPSSSQIKKSVTPDALISFVDGKPYKTLKRHLSTHGLDPYSYRQRYGLPNDYPMVAASYAAQRSALAKSIGLGRAGGAAAEPEPAPEARRTRGRKATAGE